MKKQVTMLAAMMMMSNFAMAATSSQSAVEGSFDSIESLMNHVASTSNKSVELSTSTGEKIEDVRKAIAGEATQELRKGGIVHTALGSMSAVGAFSVQAVEVTVKGATLITKYTFKGLQSGSTFILTNTEKYVAAPAAKGVDSSAQATVDGAEYVGKKTVAGARVVGGAAKTVARKTWNTGTGVVIGISASGIVLAEEIKKAGSQASNSQLLTSSATLLGSISASAQAFGSEVVEGYKK